MSQPAANFADDARRAAATTTGRDPEPTFPPAGWYPDPTDNRALTWWDGLQWHVHTKHYPPDQPGGTGFTPAPIAVPMSISLSVM